PTGRGFRVAHIPGECAWQSAGAAGAVKRPPGRVVRFAAEFERRSSSRFLLRREPRDWSSGALSFSVRPLLLTDCPNEDQMQSEKLIADLQALSDRAAETGETFAYEPETRQVEIFRGPSGRPVEVFTLPSRQPMPIVHVPQRREPETRP